MAESPIQSPLPGVFYRRPAPDQPTYVEVGDQVEVGQAIGLVEVMKQFMEITSNVKGTLTSFSVEDLTTLGPGDVVALIETN